jgi:hypothetical protein
MYRQIILKRFNVGIKFFDIGVSINHGQFFLGMIRKWGVFCRGGEKVDENEWYIGCECNFNH